jgi:Tol biopolymer transport system component/predicted Ser/Thr protein kinase
MTLESGARLGPYEIVDAVGAGGMGEVYKARDTRLDRTVALKVLPEHLAENPEFRVRLEREAKAVSSLSHPHVCALYDVGHDEGVDYLVMEFLEGESLAERLTKGPIPIEELLRVAIQIADALEKAHRSGIIHRDLKPGNIMLTREGAKLLDFGLAKAEAGLAAAGDMTASPTASQPLTAAGTVLGTYLYMAPEQLECKEVDARTDIFALGAVLYEMATGQRAFSGESSASLIAGIMHQQPQPASQVQPMTPPALDRVIQTCLAKNPDDRWQTAHDVKLQLQWISEGGSVVGLPAPVVARRKNRERLAWVAAAAAAVAAALFAVGFVLRAPQQPRQVRFEIQPPVELSFVGSPRLSPDGRMVAFFGTDESGITRIWVRPLDSMEARPLPGTETTVDTRPFWSPDSKHIGFFTGTKLKRIPVDGGPSQTVCDADGADGTWSTTGEIIYDGEADDPLHAVAAGGGIPKPVVEVDTEAGETSLGWPEFLPDGRRFVYQLGSGGGERSLMLGELGSDEKTFLVEADSRAQFVEPGYLLYVREETLVAQPFNARTGKITGEPRPLADQVGASTVGLADFSASRDGILAYRAEVGIDVRQLVWRDRAGRSTGVVGEPAMYGAMWLAPTGDRIAVDVYDPQSEQRDLWIHDLERGTASRFTFDPGFDIGPVWSPDGSRVVFSSNRGESADLYMKDASGAGEVAELLVEEDELYASEWSRDGRYLMFLKRAANEPFDIWALPVDPPGEPFPVVESEFVDVRPDFSPDGRWFAYQSDESGRAEIYVRQFPGPGGKWQVSTNGGTEPQWSDDGSEIFYLDPGQHLVSVFVETGDTFRAGMPEVLFQARLYQRQQRSRYVVSADGQSFLMLSPMETHSQPPTRIVLNWTASLEE